MHPWQLLVVVAVVLIGACIQGAVGLGYGMFAGPLLAIVNPRLVPGPMLFVALFMTLAVAHRERRSLDLGQVRWALVGRIPGTVLGAAAVAALPLRGLSITFAVVVLVAVGLSLVGWKLAPDRRTLLAAGAVSGFMGTVGSIGGPPMAMVYQRHPGHSLRAILSGFFFVGTIMSIAGLVAFHRFGVAQVKDGLILLPPMLAGFALSRYLAPVLDRGWTRRVVLGISTATAALLLAQQIL